jgi:2-oxoglutarate ferredoxin oxidoreductase subunit delta
MSPENDCPKEVTGMAKGSVIINVDRCKGCELCTTVCPQGILRMSRDRFNARGYRPVVLADPEGKCTGCALCALLCPDVVLTVYREDPRRAHLNNTSDLAHHPL